MVSGKEPKQPDKSRGGITKSEKELQRKVVNNTK